MKRTFAVACLVIYAAFALAQSSTPAAKTSASPAAQGSTKDPVASSLRTLLQRLQNNTVGAIEAMPADKFSYKPTPDQMPFAHLAVSRRIQQLFLFQGGRRSRTESGRTQRERFQRQVGGSGQSVVRLLQRCFEQMDDSKLGDTIELSGGRQAPRAMAALILSSGWADDYSAAAMYLRLNGILPPSAQPKK